MTSSFPAHNGPGQAAVTYQATAPNLRISVCVDADITELHLAGELDLANANALREQIRSVLDRYDPHVLLVDLSQLAFADSTGLAAMVWAHKQLGARERQLHLRHPNIQVSQVLHVTGLDRHLSVIPAPRSTDGPDLTANAAVTRACAARNASGDVAG